MDDFTELKLFLAGSFATGRFEGGLQFRVQGLGFKA